MRVARSLLFVSAIRVDQIHKAIASDADEVILDLEDAVGLDEKAKARENLRELEPIRRCFVRINGSDSDAYKEDLRTLVQCSWIKAIVLPKVENADETRRLRSELRGDYEIIALIESAIGIENSMNIAHSGVSRLAFGSVDYSLQMATEVNEALLLYPRSRLVVASAAVGLEAPIDGPTRGYLNDLTLSQETIAARSLGMGGKFCIHPRQLAIVNESFQHLEGEIRWARAVLDEHSKSSSGVFALDGQMIDAPLIARAKNILEGTLGDQ